MMANTCHRRPLPRPPLRGLLLAVLPPLLHSRALFGAVPEFAALEAEPCRAVRRRRVADV